MADSDKPLRYSRIALLISGLSMIAAVAGFSFTAWRYLAERQVRLTLTCMLRQESPINFLAYGAAQALQAFTKNKSGFNMRGTRGEVTVTLVDHGFIIKSSSAPDLTFDSRDYSTAILLPMECRIHNAGDRRASIDDISASLYLEGKGNQFLDLRYLVPILAAYKRQYGDSLSPLPVKPATEEPILVGDSVLPLTVEPGTEGAILITVAWPLHHESEAKFRSLCKKDWRSGELLANIIRCIYPNGLSETFGRWPAMRLQVHVKTADGAGAVSGPYALKAN